MNSSETTIGILAETTWGNLPSPAVFTPVRFTGETLKIGREYVESEEIEPSGNVTDSIMVGGDASGGFDAEFSYGTFDALIESALRSTWSTNVIENAVTQKSFHIQKKQTGGGDAAVYELYKGMVVNTMAINISAKAKTTVSFTFAGKNGVTGTTLTGSFGSATDTDILDASNAFVLDEAFGLSPLPKLMSMTINIDNGLTGRPVAGSVDLLRISQSRCRVTGSASFYFQNKAMMDMFLAGTGGELAVTLGKVTGEKYSISMPSVKITDADHFSPNNEDDVMLNITWQASKDTTLGATIEITRAVA